MITKKLPIYRIVIHRDGLSGSITSQLTERCKAGCNCGFDGIESMILACDIAGVDVESPQFISAIESAVDAVANNF